MSLQNWLLVGLVAVVGFFGLIYPRPNTLSVNTNAIVQSVLQQIEGKFGSNPGPDIMSPTFFWSTATIGGGVFATTSQGAVTYTNATLEPATVIQHTASAALTATLPASSTIRFVPKAGDTRTFYLAPITTGITLAAGTGTDLNTASSTKFCVVNSVCELTFVRKTNTDIEVLLKSASGL